MSSSVILTGPNGYGLDGGIYVPLHPNTMLQSLNSRGVIVVGGRMKEGSGRGLRF